MAVDILRLANRMLMVSFTNIAKATLEPDIQSENRFRKGIILSTDKCFEHNPFILRKNTTIRFKFT